MTATKGDIVGRKAGFAVICSLVAVASFAIVGDRTATRLDFPATTAEGHTAYATTTLPPHPATGLGHLNDR